MSNPDVTFFQDDPAVVLRIAEMADSPTLAVVPNFQNGMNLGASNAPGVGINQGGGAVVGTPEQFTLLDQGRPVESGGSQTPVAREAQISQTIGGGGSIVRVGNVATTWDRTQALYTDDGAASSGGLEGALPENVIQFGTNQDNVNGQPNPATSGDVTEIGNSTLSVLATGWTIEA